MMPLGILGNFNLNSCDFSQMKEEAQQNNEDQDLVLWKNGSNRPENTRMGAD